MINATPVSPVTPSTAPKATVSTMAAAAAPSTTPGRSTLPPSPPPVTPTGNNVLPPKKKSGINLKLVIGLVILLVVGVGAAAGFYLSQRPQEIAPRASTASCEWCEGTPSNWGSCPHSPSGDGSCSAGYCCIPRQQPPPTSQPTAPPTATNCGPGSASSCTGNNPGTACNGFPGTCVANGTVPGTSQPICGCIPNAPLPIGSSCTANANCQSGKCVGNHCVACTANADCGAGRSCINNVCTGPVGTPQPSPTQQPTTPPTTPPIGGTSCTPGTSSVAPGCEACGSCGCAAGDRSMRVCNQTGTGFTAQCVTSISCGGPATSTCAGKGIGDACTYISGAAGYCGPTTAGANTYTCKPKRQNGTSCTEFGIPLASACQSGVCNDNVCGPQLIQLTSCTQSCTTTAGCRCPAGCAGPNLNIQAGQTCGGLAGASPTPSPICSPGATRSNPSCNNQCGCGTCGSNQISTTQVCNTSGSAWVNQCTNSANCAAPTVAPTTPPTAGICSGGNVINAYTQADQARGACPFVITCNCNGSIKQHCAYGNIYSCTNVGAHCTNQVCPAVGGAKVCEPGWIACLNDGTARGKICNMAGTGYYADIVNAHACGATYSCTYNYCVYNSAGTKQGCYSSLAECNSNTPGGGQCRTEGSSCQTINPDGNAPAGTRYFKGCGTDSSRPDMAGKANCYDIANGSGGLTSSCVYEAGLSCGAQITNPPASPPVVIPPGETPPPPQPTPPPNPIYACGTPCTTNEQCSSGNPGLICDQTSKSCRLAGNPTSPTCQPAVVGPQCLNITMTNVTGNRETVLAPQLGDTVRFTCGTVSGASRYIFRVIQPDGTTQMLQATGATSANYNVSQNGTYKAQCQICTGTTDNTCLPFE